MPNVERQCRHPDCTNPVAAPVNPGRRPTYCVEHLGRRQAAQRARERQELSTFREITALIDEKMEEYRHRNPDSWAAIVEENQRFMRKRGIEPPADMTVKQVRHNIESA